MDIRNIRTLIDGYNALFALGWMPPGKSSSGGASILQAARNRLVAWIDTKSPDPASVVIVFDGRGSREQGPFVSKREGSKRGVQVVFSQGEADDLLEDIILRHPIPGRLEVVSDDRRIREAAQRRKACPLDVAEWFENWEKGLVPAHSASPEDKAVKDTRADLNPSEMALLRQELEALDMKPEKGDPLTVFHDKLVEQLKRMASGQLPPEPRLKAPRTRKPPPL